MDNLIKIQGFLTSRIETKRDKNTNETYHYGFFKLENQTQETPVIFKDNKPRLIKGTPVELTGTWSQGEDRPSFTCSDFKIITEVNHNKNLYQKLHQVQSQTGKINKSELNKFQNYKYFTEQQALNILKPLLAEQKLTLTFSDEYNHSYLDTQKKDGEKEWVVQYLKKAILTNSENPSEQLTFHFWAIGSNTDPAKAKGCAETYAIKYFLTKFFLIPTTDELDPDLTKPKDGRQETAEQIKARHEEKDHKRMAELKLKYGVDWKLSREYKDWRGINNE